MTERNHPKEHLGPEDRGLWTVTTESGTLYHWDLDNLTIRRRPSPTASTLEHDDVSMAIITVVAWPTVGQRAHFWVNDPEHPWAMEHWVITSLVASIASAGRDL